MQTKKTTVRLIASTSCIVETIYCEWMASRTDHFSDSPDDVRDRIFQERAATKYPQSMPLRSGSDVTIRVSEVGLRGVSPGPYEREVRKIFEDCVDMRVPIAETVGFVFLVEHMSISLREQWVRHRVGHKYNGDFGFEPVPNQHDSSFWSQTFRAKDMGKFYTEGEFYEPEWLDSHGGKVMEGHEHESKCKTCLNYMKFMPGPDGGRYKCVKEDCPNKGVITKIPFSYTVRRFWQEQHGWIQGAYQRLAKVGMPLEDVRNILPLGCQHSMSWSCNLSSLMHILSKRGCWIAQLGMWEPVVRGIVDELVNKVDPYFARLIEPPCIKNDKFDECRFHKENDEYIKGTDPHHPCPLWLYNHGDRAHQVGREPGVDPTWYCAGSIDEVLVEDKQGRSWFPRRPNVTGSVGAERADFEQRKEKYEQLWHRDPLTGERKQLS